MKKFLTAILTFVLIAMATVFVGCDSAENIQHNISVESDNFNTYRRVTVVNLRSDKVLLQIEGYISIKDSTADELAIIIKTAPKEYKMHYVYTGSEIVYLVEQLENTNTDPYHWDIKIFAVFPEIELG
jgi:hypothetical protein